MLKSVFPVVLGFEEFYTKTSPEGNKHYPLNFLFENTLVFPAVCKEVFPALCRLEEEKTDRSSPGSRAETGLFLLLPKI